MGSVHKIAQQNAANIINQHSDGQHGFPGRVKHKTLPLRIYNTIDATQSSNLIPCAPQHESTRKKYYMTRIVRSSEIRLL